MKLEVCHLILVNTVGLTFHFSKYIVLSCSVEFLVSTGVVNQSVYGEYLKHVSSLLFTLPLRLVVSSKLLFANKYLYYF